MDTKAISKTSVKTESEFSIEGNAIHFKRNVTGTISLDDIAPLVLNGKAFIQDLTGKNEDNDGPFGIAIPIEVILEMMGKMQKQPPTPPAEPKA
jgi:hypothetical protein